MMSLFRKRGGGGGGGGEGGDFFLCSYYGCFHILNYHTHQTEKSPLSHVLRCHDVTCTYACVHCMIFRKDLGGLEGKIPMEGK